MELYKEILIGILSKNEVCIYFPDLKFNANKLIEMESYNALQNIRAIVENGGLSDFECVEKIVRVLEEIGSGCGGRHDFS